MADVKFIKDKGLVACRDIKAGEMYKIDPLDLYLWEQFILEQYKPVEDSVTN